MAKQISIVVPAAGEDDALNLFDIALEPGATVGETRDVLGLKEFLLRTQYEDEPPLSESDNLYARVRDGDYLYAATRMDVG